MIYITGDTHGDFAGRFNADNFPEQKEMTKEDYVIICGDFGGIWDYEKESAYERNWLDWFNTRNYTLLFIDGNHENFHRLYQYPKKEWHGGKVHEIRPSVLHLMRGQVYQLNGKTIFTFGGAASHDITGGILEMNDPDFKEKKKALDKGYLPYRINGKTWWKEELASEEEKEEGRRNLRACHYKVDYIISHECATRTKAILGGAGRFQGDEQSDYLEEIKQITDYKKWFFGHYHDNLNVNDKEIMLYEQVIRVE